MRLSTLSLAKIPLAKILFAAVFGFSASFALGQAAPADGPYKVLSSNKVGGEGGFDYVYADSDNRHLFIPRSGRPAGRISVYDIDTLKLLTEIAGPSGHGVAVDPKSGHGFCSSKPIAMFDAKTLTMIKTIDVQGGPDGIFYEPATQRIYVLSHSAPNVTVINPVDGTVVGTIDLGGQPEQGASDGKGHVYIDVEDKSQIAVVDANTLQCTAHYDISGKGGAPAGMAMDTVNGILFSFCADPNVCMVVNAADGKILDTLPIGAGVDAAEWNPNTMEAFSSQGDGTLTVVKENSPTSFSVEQNVQTKRGAKCSTLDAKTGQIYLTTNERAAPPAPTAPPTQPAGQTGGRRGGRGGGVVPGSFTIMVVGK